MTTVTLTNTSTIVTTDTGRHVDPDSLEMRALCNADQHAVGDDLSRADFIIQASGPREAAGTVACTMPACMDAEHELEEGEGSPMHVAARATHGDVQLDVFHQVETGLWKLDIYAQFVAVDDGITHAEALALGADIIRYAGLVDTLNAGATS